MVGRWGTLVVASAILGGPSSAQPEVALPNMMTLHTYPMKLCDPGLKWAAVVDVMLPYDLSFDKPDKIRNVWHKNTSAKPDNQNNKPPHSNGSQNKSGKKAAAIATKPEPFGIFVKSIAETGELKKGSYIMIRVVIPKGQGNNSPHLSFYGEGSTDPASKAYIYGVGKGYEYNYRVCRSPSEPNTPLDGEQQVVTFYFQTGKDSSEEADWTFNILVQDDRLENTPIIIDPKVHDTGWG